MTHKIFETPLHVRWKDLDAFNHVNNSKYLSYLEEARLIWMTSFTTLSLDDPSHPVMVAAQLNYKTPIEWPSNVIIELYADRIGSTSVTIGHRIVSEDRSVLYCDGSIVAVWVSKSDGKPVPLPSDVLAACTPRADA